MSVEQTTAEGERRPPHSTAGSATTAGAGAASQEPPAARSREPGLRELVIALLHDISGMLSDRVQLAALELRRARQVLIRMVAFALVAAIVAATAWATFWGMLVAIAIRLGMPWYGALAFVLLLNCVAAWVAFRKAWELAAYLALPATMRRLTIAPYTQPVTPAVAPPDSHSPADTAAPGPTKSEVSPA